MSSDAGKNNTVSTDNAPQMELSETFHPERTHLVGAVVLTLISLLVIGAAPQYLFWMLIFPIIFVYWVMKSSTVVNESGIHITYAFRGKKFIDWEDFKGIGFKGSRAFARTADSQEVTLPGVSFNSLPRLAQGSYGRIPDALTAGLEAQDGKVAVVNEDGYSVLLTKEEYIARQKALGKEIQIDFGDDNADGNTNDAQSVESSVENSPAAAHNESVDVRVSESSHPDENPESNK